MRIAGLALPLLPRSRGTALAGRRRPGQEASRRERPGWPARYEIHVKDHRRHRSRRRLRRGACPETSCHDPGAFSRASGEYVLPMWESTGTIVIGPPPVRPDERPGGSAARGRPCSRGLSPAQARGLAPPGRRTIFMRHERGGDGSMSEENGRAAGEPLAALLAGGEAGHPALIVPDSGEVLTYMQVAVRVEALAQRLAGLGVRRGDRVALRAAQWPGRRPAPARRDRSRRRGGPAQPGLHRDRVPLLPGRPRPAAAAGPGQRRGRSHRRGRGHRDTRDRRPAVWRRPPDLRRTARPRRSSASSSRAARRTSRSSCTRAARRAGRSRCRCCSAT